tara:strand:- start:7982 stop:8884 length:903 start_codon:yes stop_codon:yes gene_type:complete
MSKPKHKVSYGGQAVIEGVMIKGQNSVSVAVRRSDGSIAFLRNPIHPFFKGISKKIPLIRGIVTLAESLIVGMKSLVFSANVSAEQENDEISKSEMVGILSLSLVMAIGLFLILPIVASQPFEGLMGSDIASNIAEGVIRLAIFILYILLIGNMAQIHRVFMYHGAEHMTVHAYEHGDPLEKDFVRRYPTAHPRCGTAFLLTVMLVAIVVFTFIPRDPFWWLILSRIVLIPLIAAASYEAIRFSGFHSENRIVQILSMPNLGLQSLTTKQPTDDQIEVAIAAMNQVIEADQNESGNSGAN